MSILIKGIKLPKDGELLKAWIAANGQVVVDKRTYVVDKRTYYEKYEAVDITDTGDLVDRDEAADDACLIWGRNSSGDDAAQEIIEHLRKMKAVIPAERSEASPCDYCDERSENCCWCKKMERSEE